MDVEVESKSILRIEPQHLHNECFSLFGFPSQCPIGLRMTNYQSCGCLRMQQLLAAPPTGLPTANDTKLGSRRGKTKQIS